MLVLIVKRFYLLDKISRVLALAPTHDRGLVTYGGPSDLVLELIPRRCSREVHSGGQAVFRDPRQRSSIGDCILRTLAIIVRSQRGLLGHLLGARGLLPLPGAAVIR